MKNTAMLITEALQSDKSPLDTHHAWLALIDHLYEQNDEISRNNNGDLLDRKANATREEDAKILLIALRDYCQQCYPDSLSNLSTLEQKQTSAPMRAIVCKLIADFNRFGVGVNETNEETANLFQKESDDIRHACLEDFSQYALHDVNYYSFQLFSLARMLLPPSSGTWNERSLAMCQLVADPSPELERHNTESNITAIQEARFQLAEGYDPAYGYYGNDVEKAHHYYQLALELNHPQAQERIEALPAINAADPDSFLDISATTFAPPRIRSNSEDSQTSKRSYH